MSTKSKIILFILISFFLGAFAGSFFGNRFLRSDRTPQSSPKHQEVVKEFSERLSLDDEQMRIVDSLLEAQKTKIGDMRKKAMESYRLHRDTLRTEIRKHLSDEQNKYYDDYIKEIEEREAKWRKRYEKRK